MRDPLLNPPRSEIEAARRFAEETLSIELSKIVTEEIDGAIARIEQRSRLCLGVLIAGPLRRFADHLETSMIRVTADKEARWP